MKHHLQCHIAVIQKEGSESISSSHVMAGDASVLLALICCLYDSISPVVAVLAQELYSLGVRRRLWVLYYRHWCFSFRSSVILELYILSALYDVRFHHEINEPPLQEVWMGFTM